MLDNTDSRDNVDNITCAKMLQLQNLESSGNSCIKPKKVHKHWFFHLFLLFVAKLWQHLKIIPYKKHKRLIDFVIN